MSKQEQDLQVEQQRVDQVLDDLDQELQHLQQQASNTKTDIIDMKKKFWDDVKVNIDNAIEAVETYASIKQQTEVLAEKERGHEHVHKQINILKRLKNSPYFGRVDFVEEGDEMVESIYLGIASFMDQEKKEFLIYDWRAPIASIYYEYSPGAVQFEAPDCMVKGEMKLKRQYVIRQGQIKSMFDTSLTIGDELLQEVLGNQASMNMKSIVATIQKEQNQIIRNERSHLLIVQGAAGSGKTSAALQRVAYLLYRYGKTVKAENILLFSPNPMFNSYVSSVLPELGEDNMQQTTFQEYIERRTEKKFTVEDPFSQMEYILTATNEAKYSLRVEGIRYKASVSFMHVLEKYLEFLGRRNIIFKDITFRKEVLVSSAQIEEKFYSLAPSFSIPNRLKQVAEWLLQVLKEQEAKERRMGWVQEEIELLDRETYVKAYRQLVKKKRYSEDSFDDFQQEEQILAAMVVKDKFRPLHKHVKKLGFVDIPAMYRQLFANAELQSLYVEESMLPANWEDICRQTIEQLDQMMLAYEDATPYVYLKDRIKGFQTNHAVRHLFIDEAQDYSMFQFDFIKRLFPNSKLTVLGDINQTIHAQASDSNFAQLSSLFGNERTESITLSKSYRSTKPIVEFTRMMIQGGEAIEAFNRGGKKPSVTKVSNQNELQYGIKDAFQKLQEENYQTIALICKTAQESEEAYAALQHDLPLRLITKESTSFTSGLLVIPSYLAKGVEFDAVLIYNASETIYAREGERKLLYTACTRAMHELHLFSLGEISPFLKAISLEKYDL